MLFQLSRLGLVAWPQGKQVSLPPSFRMLPALLPGMLIGWGCWGVGRGAGMGVSFSTCPAAAPGFWNLGMNKISRTSLLSLLWASSWGTHEPETWAALHAVAAVTVPTPLGGQDGHP